MLGPSSCIKDLTSLKMLYPVTSRYWIFIQISKKFIFMYTASHKFLVVTTASFAISRILSLDHVHSTRPQLLISKYIIKISKCGNSLELWWWDWLSNMNFDKYLRREFSAIYNVIVYFHSWLLLALKTHTHSVLCTWYLLCSKFLTSPWWFQIWCHIL